MQKTRKTGPTPGQVKLLHVLLNNAGEMAYKTDYAIAASNGRTTSTSELSATEYKRVLDQLKGVIDGKYKAQNPAMAHLYMRADLAQMDNRADVMRKKVISMCYTMRMTLPSGKIDMAKVNDMVASYGPKRPKKLNQYTLNELPSLITVVEKILKHANKKK